MPNCARPRFLIKFAARNWSRIKHTLIYSWAHTPSERNLIAHTRLSLLVLLMYAWDYLDWFVMTDKIKDNALCSGCIPACRTSWSLIEHFDLYYFVYCFIFAVVYYFILLWINIASCCFLVFVSLSDAFNGKNCEFNLMATVFSFRMDPLPFYCLKLIA